jgi:hypothetical protein
VDVPGQHLDDLRVAPHHRLDELLAGETHAVHPPDPGFERRVMDRDHRRLVAMPVELGVEPLRVGLGEALAARVDEDQAEWTGIDRAMTGEVDDLLIVVARDRLPRDAQRCEPLAELVPLLARPVVGEVPCQQDEVGQTSHRVDLLDRHREPGAAARRVPADVDVGDLRDDVGHRQ